MRYTVMADASIYVLANSANAGYIIEKTVPDLVELDRTSTVLVPGGAELKDPAAMTRNSTKVFVYDGDNPNLYVTDLSFNLLETVDIGAVGGPDWPNWIYHMFADESDLYVPNWNNDNIHVFPLSTFLSPQAITSYDIGLTTYNVVSPGGVYKRGAYLYYTDQYTHVLAKLNAPAFTGVQRTDLVPAGPKLFYPEGITVDSGGYVYVCDSGFYRIVKLNPDLTYNSAAGNRAYATITAVRAIYGNCTLKDVVGSFSNGDAITFSPSGATGTASADYFGNPLNYNVVSGMPGLTDTITGPSGSGTMDDSTSNYFWLNIEMDYGAVTDGPFVYSGWPAILLTINSVGKETSCEMISDTGTTMGTQNYWNTINPVPLASQVISQWFSGTGPWLLPDAGAEMYYPFSIALDDDENSFFVTDPDFPKVQRFGTDMTYSGVVNNTSYDYANGVITIEDTVYVTDENNENIVVSSDTTLVESSLITFFPSAGLVPTLFGTPRTICNDGEFVYFVGFAGRFGM